MQMKDLSRVPNIEIRGAKSIVGVAGYLSQVPESRTLKPKTRPSNPKT